MDRCFVYESNAIAKDSVVGQSLNDGRYDDVNVGYHGWKNLILNSFNEFKQTNILSSQCPLKENEYGDDRILLSRG